jgi:Tol biopolymer transport system component
LERSRGLFAWSTSETSGKHFRFFPEVEGPFAWSPDSKRVAYGETIVSVVDIITQKARILFHTSGFGRPLWLPEENRLLMYNNLWLRKRTADSQDVNLYVTQIEPQYIKRLTDESLRVVDISGAPNGRVLAFGAHPKGTEGPSTYGVYVINSDGSALRKLRVPSIKPGWFAWSADASKIAFVREMTECTRCRPGNLRIQVANSDGSDEHTIVKEPAWNFAPAWLPDGKSILFLSDRRNAHGVYIADIKSKRTQLLADISGALPNHVRIDNNNLFVPLVWSPDAKKLATNSTGERPSVIKVIDVENPSGIRQFFGIAPSVLSWTPDSRQIAVVDLIHGQALNSITPTYVDLLGVDGSSRLKLIRPYTESAPQLFRRAWSLDGRRFACSGITVFNADGSNPRWIVNGWAPGWVQ